MEPNGLMFHAGTCSYCGQGYLGFMICSDQKTAVVLCDECDTAYLTPEDIVRDLPARPDQMNALEITYYGGRDASREEIVALGWDQFIEGEYSYYKNKAGFRISAEKAEAEQRKAFAPGFPKVRLGS